MAYVDGVPHRLTQEEYHLMTALGIMDNRLVSYEILLDVMCSDQVHMPADKAVLQGKVYSLRKKIGNDVLKLSRERGCILSGDVQFIG